MVTQSIYLYIVLLKLNSTYKVAVISNSVQSALLLGIVGISNLLSYRVSTPNLNGFSEWDIYKYARHIEGTEKEYICISVKLLHSFRKSERNFQCSGWSKYLGLVEGR